MIRSTRHAAIGAVCLAVLGATAGAAGAETVAAKAKPALYRYVSYWAFPQSRRPELGKDGGVAEERVLTAALAEGAVAGYGADEELVHSAEGFTYARWVQAKSFASLFRMAQTVHVDGGSSSPLPAGAARHWDQIYVTNFYNWKAGSWRGAYGYSGTAELRPDVPDAGEAIAALSSFYVPVFEKMLSDGVIVEYEIDRALHTSDSPRQIHFSFVIPSSEGLDRFQSALGAAIDQNSLIAPAFGGLTVNFSEKFDFMKVNATFN